MSKGVTEIASLGEYGLIDRLTSRLKKRNTTVDEVFLMTLDPDGKVSIIYKEE